VLPKDTFVGTNISLAARIEPVTEPGQIYCSQAFAALAAAEGIGDFAFECLGERLLAKDAGTLTLYRLVG
jgi:class 3 adenylate cyclase